MKRIYGKAKDRASGIRAFESRTEVWQQAGLATEIDRGDARRARREAVVLVILIAAVLVAFGLRGEIFPDGSGKVIRYVTAALLALLGWLLARTLARGLAPALFRRMDPGTAGTVGFLIRLTTIAAVIIVALRIAGVDPRTLAVGGAFTAVVLGLAAQQTLAHIFAGLVLLTTRPFVVGDRVQLRGGPMAGEIEGIVSSLGLFHTTLISDGERTMVPNNVIMQLAVIPITDPERVELRAKFSAEVTPQRLQRMIEKAVTVPLSGPPSVELEELEGDEVTLTISAAPRHPADGSQLASDVLEAVRDSNLDGKPDAYDLPTDEGPQGAETSPRGPSNGGPRG